MAVGAAILGWRMPSIEVFRALFVLGFSPTMIDAHLDALLDMDGDFELGGEG